MDRLVAALLGSDRPWTAGLAWLSGPVVRALAVRAADGMDGREVEDVEALAGDVRDQLLDVPQRSDRARKQLVPGAEACLGRLHKDVQLAREVGREAAVCVPAHERARVAVDQLDLSPAQRPGERSETGGVRGGPVCLDCDLRAPGARRGLFQHPGADLELDPDVLFELGPRLDPLLELPAPRLELVDPALDREYVPAELGHRELAAPAVVDEGPHGRLRPIGGALVPVAEDGGESVVPVREYVGFDRHQLAR